MPNDGQSIVDEVEAAIHAGSAEKRLSTARRVTDLFLASAGSFTSEQVELFDNVLGRLIKTIELRSIADISARMALAEISSQLAPIAQAPPSVIGHLARHDEIAIAGPVLRESARLREEDLIEIAETKSEQHLLAVSGRWWLKEVVTDALLARRFPSVSRRIVGNPGARVSAAGFAIIVAQAETDRRTRGRSRHPGRFALGTAPSTAEQRDGGGSNEAAVPRAAPPFRGNPHAIAAAAASADREMSRVRDFTAARHSSRS